MVFLHRNSKSRISSAWMLTPVIWMRYLRYSGMYSMICLFLTQPSDGDAHYDTSINCLYTISLSQVPSHSSVIIQRLISRYSLSSHCPFFVHSYLFNTRKNPTHFYYLSHIVKLLPIGWLASIRSNQWFGCACGNTRLSPIILFWCADNTFAARLN